MPLQSPPKTIVVVGPEHPQGLRWREAMRERGALLSLLRDGSEKARERARETMAHVRGALGLDYDRLLQRELQ